MSKKKIPDNLLITFLEEINAVKTSRRSMTVITHGVLEMFINALTERCCINGDKISKDDRTYSYAVKLTILNEKGLLTKDQYIWLNLFRQMRNEAAHGHYEFVLTKEKLAPFKTIPELHPNNELIEPADFLTLCHILVIGLWNNKLKILLPYFVTDLSKN
jgi:hypothetical protein